MSTITIGVDLANQGNMRSVPVKLVDQQVRLSWHRVREGYKVESLAIGNQIRGLLAEFGVIVAKSDLACAVYWRTWRHRQICHPSYGSCCETLPITGRSCACVRLHAIVGVGPITADAAVATVGNARELKRGRQMAA